MSWVMVVLWLLGMFGAAAGAVGLLAFLAGRGAAAHRGE